MKKIRSDLPNDIHGKLKSMAALKGMTLKDFILEILTKEANRHETH